MCEHREVCEHSAALRCEYGEMCVHRRCGPPAPVRTLDCALDYPSSMNGFGCLVEQGKVAGYLRIVRSGSVLGFPHRGLEAGLLDWGLWQGLGTMAASGRMN